MAKLVLFLLCFAAYGADISGEWSFRLVRFGDRFASARVELKTEGSKITGTLNEIMLTGSADGDTVHITGTRPNGKEWAKLDGRVRGDEMSGTVKQGEDEFSWEAMRVASTPSEPKIHTFAATKFHRVFSGAIAPVLHVKSGDTIKTSTVDAGGYDAQHVRQSLGGNPETGPFYVEGAMPGDTVAVKFQRMRLNRDTAISGDRIVPSAVEAVYYRDAKFDEKFSSDWELDRQNGTASLAKPTDRLKNFRVKLQPMMGLARWLERDYKLSPNESNVVLGTSIRCDIAEVVDPQVHIVAKISKAVLAGLQ